MLTLFTLLVRGSLGRGEHHTQNISLHSHSVVLLTNHHSENASLKVPESREQEGNRTIT